MSATQRSLEAHQPAPLHASPATYVPLPRRLLDDLRDTPVAIGVYALLGRLTQITGEPTTLSPRDLQAYDPSLSYGAARRALDRLADSGYVIITTGGRKLAYLPAWGRVHNTPLPWSRGSAGLGRPRHIVAVRLDDRLLDLCMGRLRPHPVHRAVAERYLATPLLGLREVGVYALALGAVPATSPTLMALGLLTPDGATRPLPDDRTILAIATQRAGLTPTSGALTAAGWRHAGMQPVGAVTVQGEALFFVPPGVIGEGVAMRIGDRIGTSTTTHPSQTAAERRETAPPPSASGSHGMTHHDREDGNSTTTPTPTPCLSGGGKLASNERRKDMPRGRLVPPTPSAAQERGGARTPPPSPPLVNASPPAVVASESTEAERQLRTFGVRVDTARQLADRPVSQVERVIELARARSDIRDRAAWVVSALRALPAHEPEADVTEDRPPSVVIIHRYPSLTDQQRDRWIRKFHAAVTPAEKRAVIARLEQEHPR